MYINLYVSYGHIFFFYPQNKISIKNNFGIYSFKEHMDI